MNEDETGQVDNVRINVYISPAAQAMMVQMGRTKYPNLKRSGGLIVDEALRKMYAEFKRAQSKARSRARMAADEDEEQGT